MKPGEVIVIFKNLREDLKTYKGDWSSQGFWVMVVYRFGCWRYTIKSSLIRKPFSLLYKVLYKFIQVITGIELPCEVAVGKNFRIDHFGGIIISGFASFGDNCVIRDGVTVGLRRVDDPVAPQIGHNVDIGTGAKVLGGITIGDNVVIGANAVVLEDVPSNSIAVGVPARIKTRGKHARQRYLKSASSSSASMWNAIWGIAFGSVHSAELSPENCLKIVYVDGGSRDASVRVSPGSLRGLRSSNSMIATRRRAGGVMPAGKTLAAPLIQFMDADTVLDPDWFQRACAALDDSNPAVCGHRREKYPAKNAYHRFTEMEWHYETGPCRYFGGEVLVRRSVLETTGGFDEDLVAGEDPELSYRIRRSGWQILRIDAPMSIHDINMTTFRQYLKRAYRSGYAYAEITLRFIRNPEKLWLKESIRILVKALLPIGLVIAGILSGTPLVGYPAGPADSVSPAVQPRPPATGALSNPGALCCCMRGTPLWWFIPSSGV